MEQGSLQPFDDERSLLAPLAVKVSTNAGFADSMSHPSTGVAPGNQVYCRQSNPSCGEGKSGSLS